MYDKDRDTKKDEDILAEAIDRFEESQDGTDFLREQAEEDIRFARMGDQWPEDIKKQREDEARPCLTINKLPAFVRQVVNDARQNKPGITVGPVDNGADVDTAKVISGLIRSIERSSQADIAYDTAIDHSVSNGFGFFQIGIDYAHEDTWDMECKIHRIANPLQVHWDASSTKFDSSDWDYAFVSDFLTEEVFESRYPEHEKVSFEGDDYSTLNYWLDDSKVRIADYWSRTEDMRTLLLLTDGVAIREDAFEKPIIEGGPSARDIAAMAGVEVKQTRKVKFYTVKKRVISGAEVLEEDEWPGQVIPICPVWGEEVFSEGRRYFRSMIRDARDPQTMFNFWRSASTELVALAPRAPWVGPEGFVPKGQESKWLTANNRSHAYLEYNKNTAPPQRQAFAGVPAGALQEALNASDDMKAIMGIYDSSLGARSNETSGRAILARQHEGDVSNFHFTDNLNRAIAAAGRILVEIIPSVYSPRQSIRILGEDMKEEVVKLATENADETDGEKLYNLGVGKYDVTVKPGPSYSTQREETRETLVEIMSRVPGSAQYIGDILLEHMDFVGAEKVAERLKMLLPPLVQQAEGIQSPGGPMAPGGPQVPGAPIAQPVNQPALTSGELN